MIVPDVNLLLYAHHEDDPRHDAANAWWLGLMNGTERVGVPWAVVSGFVRVITMRRMMLSPLPVRVAIEFVSGWFDYPHVVPITPGNNHLNLFRRNLEAVGVGGNLVPDAHIAALAMEYQAEVHSSDSDFARFPGLRWRNPLA